MAETPNNSFTIVEASGGNQATAVNENSYKLELLASGAVKDKDLATPPGSPVHGDRYIIAAAPTGAWAGKAQYLTIYVTNTWVFVAPKEGLVVHVDDEDCYYRCTGSAWEKLLPRVLYGSAVIDVANIANAANDTTNTITVTGAAAGDLVIVSCSISLAGLRLEGEAETNLVRLKFRNDTGGAVNLASATYRTMVFKQ